MQREKSFLTSSIIPFLFDICKLKFCYTSVTATLDIVIVHESIQVKIKKRMRKNHRKSDEFRRFLTESANVVVTLVWLWWKQIFIFVHKAVQSSEVVEFSVCFQVATPVFFPPSCTSTECNSGCLLGRKALEESSASRCSVAAVDTSPSSRSLTSARTKGADIWMFACHPATAAGEG